MLWEHSGQHFVIEQSTLGGMICNLVGSSIAATRMSGIARMHGDIRQPAVTRLRRIS